MAAHRPGRGPGCRMLLRGSRHRLRPHTPRPDTHSSRQTPRHLICRDVPELPNLQRRQPRHPDPNRNLTQHRMPHLRRPSPHPSPARRRGHHHAAGSRQGAPKPAPRYGYVAGAGTKRLSKARIPEKSNTPSRDDSSGADSSIALHTHTFHRDLDMLNLVNPWTSTQKERQREESNACRHDAGTYRSCHLLTSRRMGGTSGWDQEYIISNWMVGKESSTWDDPNHHDGRTSLSHYAKCSPAPDSAGVIPRSATYNLRKVRRFQPDVNSGDRTLSCARTGSAYYGRMPAGTYRFRLVGLTGGSPTWLKLSVRDFRIRW